MSHGSKTLKSLEDWKGKQIIGIMIAIGGSISHFLIEFGIMK